jgi:hypothetical protein
MAVVHPVQECLSVQQTIAWRRWMTAMLSRGGCNLPGTCDVFVL